MSENQSNLFNTLLRAVLPFIVGFIVTAMLFHQFRPSPTTCYVPNYTDKCRRIKANNSAPDIVVIGTSRMFTGIDPRLVESELKKRGHALSVWNLSLHYMSMAEQRKVLQDLYDQLGCRPKMVMYEPSMRLGLTLSNAPTARGAYFSDWSGFSNSWNFIRNSNKRALPKLYNLGCSGIYFLVGSINYGLFADYVFPDRYDESVKQNPKMQFMLNANGFWPSGMETNAVITSGISKEQLIRMSVTAKTKYEIESRKTELLPTGQFEIYKETDELIRDHGGIPVAVMMPRLSIPDPYYLSTEFQLSRSLKNDKTMDFINYLSRSDYPDLYHVKLWQDTSHFSEAGAEVFSRELAGEILSRLENR